MNNHAGWLNNGKCISCGAEDTSMPCSIEEAHEAIRALREENSYLKELPELEWAEVCAALMSYVVELSDAGQTGKAVDLTRAIDRGSTYVERMLSRHKSLLKCVNKLLATAESAPYGALRSSDHAFKTLQECADSCKPVDIEIDLDIDVWPSG